MIVQAARLRDGSRRITHISEVLGMEGEVIVTQDLFLYDIQGEDENGKLQRPPFGTGIVRPPSGNAPAISTWNAISPKPSTKSTNDPGQLVPMLRDAVGDGRRGVRLCRRR